MPELIQNKKGRPSKDSNPQAPNCARKLRSKAELSLEAVAESIGCRAQHLSYAERKGKRFGMQMWLKLAKYYGVSMEELLDPSYEPGDFFARKFNVKLD